MAHGASSSFYGRPTVAILIMSFLPLLFYPAAAQFGIFSFPHGIMEDLFGGATQPTLPVYNYKIAVNVMNGNDGGLPGNVGLESDREDTQNADDIPNSIENVLTGFAGKWELVSESSGVSAMHMQLLPNNKALVFDSTMFGPSPIGLDPKRPCVMRYLKRIWIQDCTAHAVIYDIETAALRPLTVRKIYT